MIKSIIDNSHFRYSEKGSWLVSSRAMSFINIFKSISNFQFPYTLDEKAVYETTLWQVFNGTRKSDSLLVTVFKANRSQQNEELIANAVHKAKILKIPGLCHVLDTFDSDPQSTFIITERVIPFPWDDLKALQRNKEGIELGISQILTTLKFLNAFVLGTISKESIFIDTKGQWLLFGLELCYKKTEIDESRFASNVLLYNRLMGLPTTTEDCKKIDSLQLGALLTELLGGSSKVPRDWKSTFQIFCRAGITLESFMSRLESTSTWSSNPLISIFHQLKELHIKDPPGRLLVMAQIQNIFFESRNLFHNLSPGFIEGLLLPELSSVIQWLITSQNNSASSISRLIPLLAIFLDLTIDTDYFPETSKNLVYECFSLQDRQVRFLLLIYLPKISKKLASSEISGKIYPRLVLGLADSDPTLRLQTLKKIPIVVSHISERQLNNELLRYLAKTQVDQDVEIRTWTVIIITQISNLLSTSSGNRSNILATAFTKSLKDPVIKPRLAALYGLNKSIELFDVTTIANKILTVIAPGLLDKDPLVRSKAKGLFQKYLNKLESEAKVLQEKSPNEKSSEDFNFDEYGHDEDTNDEELVKQFMSTVLISSNPEMETQPATDYEGSENDTWNAFEDKKNEVNSNLVNDINIESKSSQNKKESLREKGSITSRAPVSVEKSWNDGFSDDNNISDGWEEDDFWAEEEPPVNQVKKTTSQPSKKPSILKGARTSASILTPRSSGTKLTSAPKPTKTKIATKTNRKIEPENNLDEDAWDTAW